MFLPELATLVGMRLLEAWHGHETKEMLLPAPPALEVPAPRFAFDEAGDRIEIIHDRHGADVRKALQWAASQIPSRSRAKKAARGGHSPDATALTEDDWETAYEAIVLPREMRSWARTALTHVAWAIADMASRDEGDDVAITLIGRPLLGGDGRELPRTIWTTGPELRLRRLASCGLNIDAPFDPMAAATHLIFVETRGLTEAVETYAERHMVPAIPDDHPWWAEAKKVRRSWAPDLEDRIRKVLVPELRKPENIFWRLAQAQRFIERLDEFGPGVDLVVARVCNALKKEGAAEGIQYASLGRGGRPRIGLELVRGKRPVTASHQAGR